MIIEAIGHDIYIRSSTTQLIEIYQPGKPFEINDKEGKELIDCGVAKRAAKCEEDKKGGEK